MKTKLSIILCLTMLFFFNGTSAFAQWTLTGNAIGVNDFIGSTNAAAFKIRTNNTERMYISSTGFVGIGTSTPIGSGKLVISSNDIGWSGMYVNAASAGAKTFYGYATTNSISAYHYFDPGTTTWKLVIDSTDRLAVNNSGYVGIGTISPTEKLHVIGNGKFSNNLIVEGDISSYTLDVANHADFGSADMYTVTATNGGISTLTTSYFTVYNTCSINNGMVVNGDIDLNGFIDSDDGGYFSKPVTANGAESAPAVVGNADFNGDTPYLLTIGVYGDDGVYSNYNGDYSYAVYSEGLMQVTKDIEYWGDLYDISDAQFKTNITGINNSLDLIMQLKPSKYQYKKDTKFERFNLPSETDYGFIAQDLEKVFPSLVIEKTQPVNLKEPKGEMIHYKMVNYVGLIPFLTKSIQEQQTIIDQQNNQIEQLTTQIEDLNDRMRRLEELAGVKKGNNEGDINNQQRVNQLYINNPNPFDKQTTIRYYISNDVIQASILLMDMNGKVVNTFQLTEKGDNSIAIQGDPLAIGIYSYILIIDGNVADTKKMVVSR